MADVMLTLDGVRLGLTAADRGDAIRQAGEVLVEIGAAEAPYVDAMSERGCTSRARPSLSCSFPAGSTGRARTCAPVSPLPPQSDEHTDVMARLAGVLLDADKAETLRSTTKPEDVLELLEPERSDSQA